MFVGSDDGVYRVSNSGPPTGASKVLDAGRTMRLRHLPPIEGLFAATTSGLYWSPDGAEWTDLGVPRELVYAVGAGHDGGRLYAGTRPAHLYVAEVEGSDAGGDRVPSDLTWNECEQFHDRPASSEWRLPRHEDLAQVRDVVRDPGAADRIVAGVEVGGVHVSEDAGRTWTDRANGVHDDVHELHVVGPASYVAATGGGLYRTETAGQTWERIDEDVEQSYFRRAFSIGDSVYAAGALSNSSTWNDDGADPALFEYQDGSLRQLATPRPTETVTGMVDANGDLVAATHRGSLLRRQESDWQEIGSFPVTGSVTGRYTPIASGTS